MTGGLAPIGIAPGARVVAVRVLDAFNGFSGTAQVVSALDWILVNHPEVRVVNMSLGTFARFPGVCDGAAAYTQALASAIGALRANGASVFVSSGNDSSPTEMEAPACVAAAVAVGAVFDADVGPLSVFACADPTTRADQVACFSNASPALDLLAPGALISAAGRGGGTSTYAGTSQASPHAAGGAALLLSARPGLTPDQVESALESTGVPVADPRNGTTWPRIDLLAALRSVTGGVGFYTLTPCRLIDTRLPAGPLGGPALAASSIRTFTVGGACGIPADAKVLSLNVTVTGPSAPGDLRVFPGGTPAPETSVINFAGGQTRANNAVVKLPDSGVGTLAVQNDQPLGTTHLIVDVSGFFR